MSIQFKTDVRVESAVDRAARAYQMVVGDSEGLKAEEKWLKSLRYWDKVLAKQGEP